MVGARSQLGDLPDRRGETQRHIDLRGRQPGDQELADQDRGQRRHEEPATPSKASSPLIHVLGRMRSTPTTRKPSQQEDRRRQSDEGDDYEPGEEARGDDAHIRKRGHRTIQKV